MGYGLENKVAVVTGGLRGIGRSIAEKLASAGVYTVVVDLPSQEEIQPPAAWGKRLSYMQMDVTRSAEVKRVMGDVFEQYDRLDILVNNAGIMFEKTIEETSEDDWDRMMNVNLKGVFLCSKHSIAFMRRTGGGAIINIGSIEGLACNPLHTAYAASKGGVHALTRATAVDCGKDGIRCNTICPGWINTELNAAYFDNLKDRKAGERAIEALHPVGRMGVPEDIAHTVLWLASEASGFITGQEIIVDGGRLARPSLADFDSMEKTHDV